MKIQIELFVAIILFILSGLNCEKNHVSPECVTVLSDYTFIYKGCESTALEKSSSIKRNSGYLDSYEYSKGILTLDLGFFGVCNASYKDSVIASKDNIAIYLTDTTRIHVACLCYNGCDFAFDIGGINKIGLKLYVGYYLQNDYITYMDTTLTFYHVKFDL